MLARYSVIHGVLDAVCFYVIYAIIGNLVWAVAGFFLYDFLQLGLQPFLGNFFDNKKGIKTCGIVGCALVALSPLLGFLPMVALLFAGVGNAMFHIAGGSYVLKNCQGNAATLGLFVAPGAIGIVVGKLVATGKYLEPWAVALILAVCLVWLMIPPKTTKQANTYTGDFETVGLNVLVLCLVSIVLRSFVGSAVALSWLNGLSDSSKLMAPIIIGLAVFLGKLSGGFLCDRISITKDVAGNGEMGDTIILTFRLP